VRFKVETIVRPDNGTTENAHGLEGKLLTKRKVDFVDVAYDPKVIDITKEDPAAFRSATGRGPMQPGWHEGCQPVCCAYKLATIHINMFGIQKKVEKLIQKQALRLEHCKSHRQMICWMDEWEGMSLDQIQAYEEQTKAPPNPNPTASALEPVRNPEPSDID